MDPSQLSFGLAFAAGLVSFLSPCMLPLVPIYLSQLVGQSVAQTAEGPDGHPARFVTLLHSVMFVCGFTLAFVTLGATASVLGSFLRAHQYQLRQIGGILLIIIGLHLAGIAATAATLRQGVALLLFYSLGMGLPFLLLGLGLNQASRVLKWLKPHVGKIEVGAGVVMILVGVMIYFNWLVYLNRYFAPFIRL